ncbi:hypothetical protein AB0903_34220 [Streptomyces sp. NPDC048389]|uniref:hypothetical protein n=1 Tax=Streptomyces sp. NPDC048389 TaxID=3154622 RepID=UPI0034520AC6
MCIRVQYAPLTAACSQPYDARHQVITLPEDLPRRAAIRVIRAVLSELAITQPDFGAVCWCGAPVGALPRIPHQARREQVSHGA